jgi:hypothetical protein
MRRTVTAAALTALVLWCAARADTPLAAHPPAQPLADATAAAAAQRDELLAYSAAMAGRKAETLAAVQRVAQAVPLDRELANGASGWNLAQQYAALVRAPAA